MTMNSNSLSGITSITASGDITGNKGSFDTLVITGTSTWKPLTPTSRGVYIGLDSIATGGLKSSLIPINILTSQQ